MAAGGVSTDAALEQEPGRLTLTWDRPHHPEALAYRRHFRANSLVPSPTGSGAFYRVQSYEQGDDFTGPTVVLRWEMSAYDALVKLGHAIEKGLA